MGSPSTAPLTVAWISDFPVEWLPDVPPPLKGLPKGHSASWLRVLLDEFERDPRIKLHVFAFRKQLDRHVSFERNGVVFHVIKSRGGIRAPTLFWSDTFALRSRLKQIRPDVVHAWGSERGAALVAHRLRYPYVMTVQGLLNWYAEIVTLNSHERFGVWLERMSLPRAPLVTTESTFAIQYLKTHFPSVPTWQAEHAPNWVFHKLERKPQCTPIRFLFVGTAGLRKGTDLILAALDQLKSTVGFELVIVGGFEPSFLDNHDMNRLLWLAKGDKRKLQVAAAIQFTLAAPPIIYYGTEVGIRQKGDVRATGYGRDVEARGPMLWGAEQDADLLAYYQRLAAIRHAHPAIRHGTRVTLHLDEAARTYAYAEIQPGEIGVLVALNLSGEARRLQVPLPAGQTLRGTPRDLLNGHRVTADGPTLQINLPPLAAALIELG